MLLLFPSKVHREVGNRDKKENHDSREKQTVE